MPTYDYVCSSCGRVTEIVHSINASGPAACPACGAVGTLTKAFNPPTIHFKGSGWAKKDRSGVGSKPSRAADASSKDGTAAEPASAAAGNDDVPPKDAAGGEGKSGSSTKAGDSKPRPAAKGSSSGNSSSASAD